MLARIERMSFPGALQIHVAGDGRRWSSSHRDGTWVATNIGWMTQRLSFGLERTPLVKGIQAVSSVCHTEGGIEGRGIVWGMGAHSYNTYAGGKGQEIRKWGNGPKAQDAEEGKGRWETYFRPGYGQGIGLLL